MRVTFSVLFLSAFLLVTGCDPAAEVEPKPKPTPAPAPSPEPSPEIPDEEVSNPVEPGDPEEVEDPDDINVPDETETPGDDSGAGLDIPEENKEESSSYTTFRIPRGNHNSVTRFKPFYHSKMEYEAIFNNSAVYTSRDPNNQCDINKLPGFSDCERQHHDNSARFGWRWANNQLQIFTYTYVNGQRQANYVDAISLNEPHKFTIEAVGDKYVFTLDGKSMEVPRGCDTETARGYELYPYFGGDEVAPHDVTIDIKYL